MKTFLNIIWHIPFLGFLFALSYAIIGCLFCITVVGLPIGLGLLQFSKFLLWPHGNKMVNKADLHELKETKQNPVWKVFALIVRILYFPFGLLGAISCIVTIVCDFVSLIGIPSGLVWAKSLGTIFNPVNKVCVPEFVALEIERKKQERYLKNNGMDNTSTLPENNATVTINSPANDVPPPMPNMQQEEAVLPPPLPVTEHSGQEEVNTNVSQIVAALAANNDEPKVVIPLPEEENVISTEVEEIVSAEAPVIVEEITEEANTVEATEIATETIVETPENTGETITETTEPVFAEEEVVIPPATEEVVEEFGYVEVAANEEIVYGGIEETVVTDDSVEVSGIEEVEASPVQIEEITIVEEYAVEPVIDTVEISEETTEAPDDVVESRVSEGIIDSYEIRTRQDSYISDETNGSDIPPPLPTLEKEEVKEEVEVKSQPVAPEPLAYEQPKQEPVVATPPPVSETSPLNDPIASQQPVKKKSSSKKAIIIVVFALAVLIGGGTAAYVILSGSTDTNAEQPVAPLAESTEKESEEEALIKPDALEESNEETDPAEANETIEDVVEAPVADVAAAEKPVEEKAPVSTPKTVEKETPKPSVNTVKETPPAKVAEPVTPKAPEPHPAYGTKNYPSGTVYTGNFNAAGLRHGQGVYTWPSGDRYEGNWINDKATGNGTYYSREGWKYVGQFVDLKFHGEGVYYFANGKSRKGKWENGQLQK